MNVNERSVRATVVVVVRRRLASNRRCLFGERLEKRQKKTRCRNSLHPRSQRRTSARDSPCACAACKISRSKRTTPSTCPLSTHSCCCVLSQRRERYLWVNNTRCLRHDRQRDTVSQPSSRKRDANICTERGEKEQERGNATLWQSTLLSLRKGASTGRGRFANQVLRKVAEWLQVGTSFVSHVQQSQQKCGVQTTRYNKGIMEHFPDPGKDSHRPQLFSRAQPHMITLSSCSSVLYL